MSKYVYCKILYIYNKSITLLNDTQYSTKYSNTLHKSKSQPLANGKLKSPTKKHLESKNNVVGHTIFTVQPTCQLGP